ncbi:hypothetical protein AX16_008483 [Volvariella volvacea WC 439]|nr:hypothetical protein AX16_008483 [Volvariella volvacea WC 439]
MALGYQLPTLLQCCQSTKEFILTGLDIYLMEYRDEAFSTRSTRFHSFQGLYPDDSHVMQQGSSNTEASGHLHTAQKYPSYSQSHQEHPLAPQLPRQGMTSHSVSLPPPAFSSTPHFERGNAPTALNTIAMPSLLPTGSSEHSPVVASSSTDGDAQPHDLQPPPTTRAKKPRKPKPRIELAPDQPPTTQGRPRARVYVACIQWQVVIGILEVNPHKLTRFVTPGARQRIVRNDGDEALPQPRRRRRRTEATDSNVAPNRDSSLDRLGVNESPSAPASSPDADAPSVVETLEQHHQSFSPTCSCHGSYQCPATFELSSLSKSTVSFLYEGTFGLGNSQGYTTSAGSNSYISEIDKDGNKVQQENDIGSQPSLNFTRKVWWDSILGLYLSAGPGPYQPLSSSQREAAAQAITTDIRFLFRASNYWFSFFHVPTFFASYFDPVKRERIQPSLILALLAMATFWQSSEVGFGDEGRRRALKFRDEAQAALEASFNAGWIDETLAQAAWLLALFEVCAHPGHTSARTVSSMVMLDSIIRSLSLTIMDADDPNTSIFSPGTVPIVTRERQAHHSTSYPDPPTSHRGCSCTSITLAEQWPSAAEHAPLWGHTPAWNGHWSDAEIRKESCRRLCWSSMILAAGHIAYSTAVASPVLDLFIADPANYALLFSGESIACSPSLQSPQSSKSTVWALHDRAFLLWHSCIRMRKNPNVSDTVKSDYTMKAWIEADTIEEALNQHTCSIERACIFQGREYIFNTRMFISYEFRRYIPLASAGVHNLFHRRKAEEWLNHQAAVAGRFMQGLHTITGNLHNLLARRPFFVFWFMGQISRSLSLWHCDPTLIIALDVCKALLPPIDYLSVLWPCPEQRRRYVVLRQRLDEACFQAQVPPPPPMNLSMSLSSLV